MDKYSGIVGNSIGNPGLYMVAGVEDIGKTLFLSNMVDDFNSLYPEKYLVYCYSGNNDVPKIKTTDRLKMVNMSGLPYNTGHILLEASWTYEDYGLSAIVVEDYRFLLRSEFLINGANLSKKNRLLYIFTRLKTISESYDIPVILVTGVDEDFVYGRADKFPVITDIADGKFIKLFVDRFLFLHREEMFNPETEMKGILDCRLYDPLNEYSRNFRYVCIPETGRCVEKNENCNQKGNADS